MKQENVFKIGIIMVAVLATGGVVGFLLTQRAQTPVAVPAVQKTTTQTTETQKTTSPTMETQKTTQAQTIPANFKTYIGDLSQLSSQFVGKKISFNYPAAWGDASLKIEEAMFPNPANKPYNIASLTFATFPGDKLRMDGQWTINIVDQEKYGISNDITFLQKISASNSPVGENDFKALDKLGHGYGKTAFFGVNLAKKFVPKNLTTSDQQAKGVTFFMEDGQDYGVTLSYNVTLLDQKSKAIIGGQFYVTSKQQDQLEKELNVLLEKINSNIANNKYDKAMEQEMSNATDVWGKKFDAFVSSSYNSNPDYMTQVKDIDLVMQSVKIQ